MLVPEIALTSQLVERMERIFRQPRHGLTAPKLTARRRTEPALRLSGAAGGEAGHRRPFGALPASSEPGAHRGR